MKHLLLVLTFFISITATFAQSSETITLNGYTKTGANEVIISLNNTSSFIVGANRYVLHIGAHHFLKNKHPDGRLDEIQFILTVQEFEALQNGAPIVLVYGLYHENTQQDGESLQTNGFTGLHWKIGTFESTQLK